MEITEGGKRIISEEEKKAVVERYKESELSRGAFCEREGISKSALYSWTRKYGGAGGSKFVELGVKRALLARGIIELELPHGIKLKIQS